MNYTPQAVDVSPYSIKYALIEGVVWGGVEYLTTQVSYSLRDLHLPASRLALAAGSLFFNLAAVLIRDALSFTMQFIWNKTFKKTTGCATWGQWIGARLLFKSGRLSQTYPMIPKVCDHLLATLPEIIATVAAASFALAIGCPIIHPTAIRLAYTTLFSCVKFIYSEAELKQHLSEWFARAWQLGRFLLRSPA